MTAPPISPDSLSQAFDAAKDDVESTVFNPDAKRNSLHESIDEVPSPEDYSVPEDDEERLNTEDRMRAIAHDACQVIIAGNLDTTSEDIYGEPAENPVERLAAHIENLTEIDLTHPERHPDLVSSEAVDEVRYQAESSMWNDFIEKPFQPKQDYKTNNYDLHDSTREAMYKVLNRDRAVPDPRENVDASSGEWDQVTSNEREIFTAHALMQEVTHDDNGERIPTQQLTTEDLTKVAAISQFIRLQSARTRELRTRMEGIAEHVKTVAQEEIAYIEGLEEQKVSGEHINIKRKLNDANHRNYDQLVLDNNTGKVRRMDFAEFSQTKQEITNLGSLTHAQKDILDPVYSRTRAFEKDEVIRKPRRAKNTPREQRRGGGGGIHHGNRTSPSGSNSGGGMLA
jgi:hypothetical protein